MLCTAEVRDALVALQTQVTTAAACYAWCSAICNLTGKHAANKQLLGEATVRDALVALQPQATTATACQAWCTVICKLTATKDATL
jgi:hypothetical protein